MNIREIASLAGVSRAAVSRYFNDGYLSEEKRMAIQKVVEETGYKPLLQAQTLRTKKTKMIGIVMPKLASYSLGHEINGILSVLNETGYKCILADTQNDVNKEIEYLKSFRSSQVDGVIFIATIDTPKHHSVLKKMDVPVVIVGQNFKGNCSIYHDDYNAMHDMAKLVISKGRRHIAYIGVTKKDIAAGQMRYDGFVNAIEEVDEEIKKTIKTTYFEGEFNSQSGFEGAKEVLSIDPQIDAIVCATDTIAIGVYKYLKSIGKEIPTDIIVTGHGDSSFSNVVTPELTTVHYYYEESGVKAAQQMLSFLKKNDQNIDNVKEIKMGYSIIERDSSRV